MQPVACLTMHVHIAPCSQRTARASCSVWCEPVQEPPVVFSRLYSIFRSAQVAMALDSSPHAEKSGAVPSSRAMHSVVDDSQSINISERGVVDHPVIRSVLELDTLYEVFDERDGATVLSHCTPCYCDNEDAAYFGRSTQYTRHLTPQDLSKALTRIPDHEILYPEFPPSATVYTGAISAGLYIKRVKLVDYEDLAGTDYLARLCRAEVEIHELLRQHPHQHVVKYHGLHCQARPSRRHGLGPIS